MNIKQLIGEYSRRKLIVWVVTTTALSLILAIICITAATHRENKTIEYYGGSTTIQPHQYTDMNSLWSWDNGYMLTLVNQTAPTNYVLVDKDCIFPPWFLDCLGSQPMVNSSMLLFTNANYDLIKIEQDQLIYISSSNTFCYGLINVGDSATELGWELEIKNVQAGTGGFVMGGVFIILPMFHLVAADVYKRWKQRGAFDQV